jgi:hypothetical protein
LNYGNGQDAILILQSRASSHAQSKPACGNITFKSKNKEPNIKMTSSSGAIVAGAI